MSTLEDKLSNLLVIIWRSSDPVAFSRVQEVLEEADIEFHVKSTHDHLAFGLGMPRPFYEILVRRSDYEKALARIEPIRDLLPLSPHSEAIQVESHEEETTESSWRQLLPWLLVTACYFVLQVALVLSAALTQNPFLSISARVLSLAALLGCLWMIYQAIRYEKPAGKYVLAALIPFLFVGYFVERYRKRKTASRVSSED